MEIAGYPHYENVCSNILKFYIDPNAEHGLGPVVLNCLLASVDPNLSFTKTETEVLVEREVETANKKRLDLLITTDQFVIGVENKIFHHLHNDLFDYSRTVLQRCSNTEKRPIRIVLTLNKLGPGDLNKAAANDFVNVSYDELFTVIKKRIGVAYNGTNISYINHLFEFIKTIENLNPKTMENRDLHNFFIQNSKSIIELSTLFNKYKQSVQQRVFHLQSVVNQVLVDSTAKQWIYESRCLVHDYTIGEFKIAVDVYSGLEGWEILLFGRNPQSGEFLSNTMCRDSRFLPQPYESYEWTSQRMCYQRFPVEVDIQTVECSLTELLNRIENYKKVIEHSQSAEVAIEA